MSFYYGKEIKFMLSEEGEVGPSAFFITNDHKILSVVDPLARKIKIFDIPKKKLVNSIKVPPATGEWAEVLISSKGNIYYLFPTDMGKHIIRKIDYRGKILFEITDLKIPKHIRRQIQKEYFEHERAHLPETQIYWEMISLNEKEELFVKTRYSVLKYSPEGKFVGIVPGMGYQCSSYLFRLDPEGNYKVGGKLSIFEENGRKIKTVNIPKDRNLLPEFKEKSKYGIGSMIEIAGVDKYNNIYITTVRKKVPPILIEKPDFMIRTINVIYKFRINGDLIKTYRILGGIGEASMNKLIQVTSDGSIYYWKYFKDRMELWRILPQ